MIKHLILDIGNVICDWNPDALVASVFNNEQDQQRALQATVQNSDWLALDRGAISLEHAIERAQKRSSLAPDAIAEVYKNLCASLVPLPQSVAAMHRAYELEVPLYILSNMQAHAWNYLSETFSCWQACKGVVVSCDTGFIKPEKAIYLHLCERFSLKPHNCLFIDDMQENIDAAVALGMQGIQLTNKQKGGEVIDQVVDQIIATRV